MPLNEIIFTDTGKEYPEMYEHLELVEKNIGMKITRLKASKTFDYMLYEKPVTTKNLGIVTGYTWTRPWYRWCTSDLKRGVINKYLAEIKKTYNLIQYIGYAVDEQHRLKRKNALDTAFQYPLNEWGWSEADALQFCKERGYTWGGLYDIFKRVSCFCCPLRGINSLRLLWKHRPKLFEEIERMDACVKRIAHDSRDVFMGYMASGFGGGAEKLRARFEFERDWEKHGKPLRTKEFYKCMHEATDRVGCGWASRLHRQERERESEE